MVLAEARPTITDGFSNYLPSPPKQTGLPKIAFATKSQGHRTTKTLTNSKSSPGPFVRHTAASRISANSPVKATIYSPQTAALGYKERINVERRAGGLNKFDAALEAGRSPHIRGDMLDFLIAQESRARHGLGGKSAAGGELKAVPKPEAKIDCRSEAMKRAQADKEKNFGLHGLDFSSPQGVKECVFGGHQSKAERAAAREKMKQLKKQLRAERHARRSLEESLSECGWSEQPEASSPSRRGARGPRQPLPPGWLETRDAQGRACYHYTLTRHTVYQRPTELTSTVAEPDSSGRGVKLLPGWYETRDAENRVVWRNKISMEVTREAPLAHCALASNSQEHGSPKHLSPNTRRTPLPSQLRSENHLKTVLGKGEGCVYLVN